MTTITKIPLVEVHFFPICRFIPCCLHALGHIARCESLQRDTNTSLNMTGRLYPTVNQISSRDNIKPAKRVQMKDIRHIALMNSGVDCVAWRESPIPGSPLSLTLTGFFCTLDIKTRWNVNRLFGLKPGPLLFYFSPPLRPVSHSIYLYLFSWPLHNPLHLPLFLLKYLYVRTTEEDLIEGPGPISLWELLLMPVECWLNYRSGSGCLSSPSELQPHGDWNDHSCQVWHNCLILLWLLQAGAGAKYNPNLAPQAVETWGMRIEKAFKEEWTICRIAMAAWYCKISLLVYWWI